MLRMFRMVHMRVRELRFRQSRSSLQHERLFQPRQSAASQEHGAALPRRGLQTYPLSAL